MFKLSNRLYSCAGLVRRGKRLADIGCDHGLVPVYLAKNGLIKSAVAADINEKPLFACRALVEKYSLEGKIKCVISDGMQNIGENEIDDILLAGMGGELASAILSRCSYAQKKHIIINPTTHAECARKWLFGNGFSIKNDFIVADGRYHYSVFDAYYTGKYEPYDELKCYLGEISDFSDREYFAHLLSYLKDRSRGEPRFKDIALQIEEKINDNG